MDRLREKNPNLDPSDTEGNEPSQDGSQENLESKSSDTEPINVEILAPTFDQPKDDLSRRFSDFNIFGLLDQTFLEGSHTLIFVIFIFLKLLRWFPNNYIYILYTPSFCFTFFFGTNVCGKMPYNIYFESM